MREARDCVVVVKEMVDGRSTVEVETLTKRQAMLA